MPGKLEGKKVAILATDGVEQVEFTEPRDASRRRARRSTSSRSSRSRSRASTTWTRARPSASTCRCRTRTPATTTRSCCRAASRTPTLCEPMTTPSRSCTSSSSRASPWRDLPRSLDARRGRCRARPQAHLVALAADRSAQRRRRLGRRGGRGRPGSRDEPEADDLPAFCAKLVEEFAEGAHVGQHA